MKRFMISPDKLRLLKNPHSFLHFWIRSLYGALLNSRIYASCLNLNLKFCSSRWRIVLFIVGAIGLILVILAIIKYSSLPYQKTGERGNEAHGCQFSAYNMSELGFANLDLEYKYNTAK